MRLHTTVDPSAARAVALSVSDDTLTVNLFDGRTISVPLSWYPRLLHASASERKNWSFVLGSRGIRWPDLDEDVSIDGLLLGRLSGESQVSLERWLRRCEVLSPPTDRPPLLLLD